MHQSEEGFMPEGALDLYEKLYATALSKYRLGEATTQDLIQEINYHRQRRWYGRQPGRQYVLSG